MPMLWHLLARALHSGKRRDSIQNAAVSVTQGTGQRIRRIGGREGWQIQQNFHHLLDLRFLGAAVTGHCLFDAGRRVFVQFEARFGHRADRRAARLPQYQRAGNITLHKHLFHRDFIGTVFAYQLAQLLE